ncbi:hypothetical protein PPERSA_07235 [Pseudocohnilembus persalinus]|uniref:RRM domain-containing protein n=1 Tax=Pseudocohnilembus persalinus TaxID=266149 RepID=A0A0V0QCV3_PSEPJ|nr:hypothetical protein PPERSA_07235 [Pseudocohnilembus persalinus]|eukprot:KRX00038.1 hypothetical protein PPERSA_07235 [Pseudocohnilembus persalinus]
MGSQVEIIMEMTSSRYKKYGQIQSRFDQKDKGSQDYEPTSAGYYNSQKQQSNYETNRGGSGWQNNDSNYNRYDNYKRYDRYDNYSKYDSNRGSGGYYGHSYKDDYKGGSSYRQERGSYDYGKGESRYSDRVEEVNRSPQAIYEEDIEPIEKFKIIYGSESNRKGFTDSIMKNNPNLDDLDINALVKVKLISLEKNNEEEFQFDYDDLQNVFCYFGIIQKIIVKEKGEAYIQFMDFISAHSAQKALNDFVLTDCNIQLKVQLCFEKSNDTGDMFEGNFQHDTITEEDYIIKINNKEASNLYRLIYLSEKNACQRDIEQDGEVLIKLVENNYNREKDQMELLIMTNNYSKYDCAVRYAHELLSQILEEYKKFCERLKVDMESDIHVKRIEKFNSDIELVFKEGEEIEKALEEKLQSLKEQNEVLNQKDPSLQNLQAEKSGIEEEKQ